MLEPPPSSTAAPQRRTTTRPSACVSCRGFIYTMTLEKTRDIATLKVVGAPDRTIAGLILQEALTLGLLGYATGAVLISGTYQYFPRRVVVTAFDQFVLLVIVVGICVVASLVGIWKALRVDPTAALGGGA